MASLVRSVAVGSLLFIGATAAQADVGVVSFTGGSSFSSYDGTFLTIGFEFSTASAITVSGLGWYVASGTLASSHEVGLWDSGGTLLGSTTVTAGSATSGGFRYVSVPTLTLAAGDYYIGGGQSASDGDLYKTSVSNIVTGTGITFLAAARSGSSSGFAFPSVVSAASGRFGPNFVYTAAAVPEPASWAMLIAGFGIMGAAMRHRRRVSIAVAA
jgi:hypothetical protein